MGSPEDEPKGLYGIEMDGSLSPRWVTVIYPLFVIAFLIVPAVAAMGTASPWWFGFLVASIVVAAVTWRGMSRNLVSIHVHRSDDGELWMSGMSVRGGLVTALVRDVERIKGPSSRFSIVGIALVGQRSIGLGMRHNDVASFVERLTPDLPPGTKVKRIRHQWFVFGTKRFYDDSAVTASRT